MEISRCLLGRIIHFCSLFFQEGVLILLRQLSTSTVNTKKFLERGLLDELVLLLLLGNNEDLQREAVNCISEVGTWEE